MAIVICDRKDCKYRSKRKLKLFKRESGFPCYGCTLDAVVIGPVFDFDGDIEAVAGKKNTAVCKCYEPDK
jgi:hypothetical protein